MTRWLTTVGQFFVINKKILFFWLVLWASWHMSYMSYQYRNQGASTEGGEGELFTGCLQR